MTPSQAAKKSRIEDSALHLFLEKGIEQTSVNDIVKQAHLAKGTFYLYYKDKAALIDEIIIEKNIAMLEDIMTKSQLHAQQEKRSWVACFAQLLIQYYQENPAILRMISRNIQYHQNNLTQHDHAFSKIALLDSFLLQMQKHEENIQVTRNRFLLLLEVIGVVCYNAMYYAQPDTIEHIVPILYENIAKIYE